MTGMNKYDAKDRRKARRQLQRDHLKEDLRLPKYRERTIPNKKKNNGRRLQEDDEEAQVI
jgi:hypothetical protein